MGDKRLIDITVGDLANLIEERVAAALERERREREAPLVDSLEAGRMLGIRQRLDPGPEPPDRSTPEWADWARRRQEADTRMRQAVWARACGPRADPRLGELVRRQGDRLLFDRAGLEQYIRGLDARRRGQEDKSDG